ncbi:Ig-like domain-containing protein [Nitrosarchaeum sp. AC2]|uniref:Ig-like domain-containing protein n=1 Tax=Nitrosarchaeum sp. AC2 TaxID=2259673 RepID=UPI0015C79A3D|nr:Ig-like domain-containing protein [Nitrosarchaeum sp. AC2]
MINRNIGFILTTLLLVSSMFFPSLQNVYADDTITISTDTVYATNQVLTDTKIIIQNNAKLEIAFGTTITLQRSSIEIKSGSELIIDGTLLFTTPFHSKQYLLNTGTLNLRCGLYPAPTSAFSYTNFGIGTVTDSACPGNIDKIIIDGNDVSIQIGENATIPVGRDAIILHTLYVAGLIDNFGSVSNQGLVTLDNGKVVNSGTWTNVCDNFDSRGIKTLNGGIFQGNPAKKTTCALPIALPDNYSVDEDGILIVSTLNGVLKNDSDADSPTLLVTLDTILPKFGIVNLNSDGSFEYVPQTDFFGTDKFSYKVDDGTDGFATALVTINVIPSNDSPVANNDSITVNEDSLATNIKTIVLSNDTDPDGDVLTITSAGLTTIPKGLVSVINGQLTYNPNSQFEYLKAGQTGTDSFEYTVSDGQLTSTAIVTVTITGQNDKPVALPDNYSLNQNSVLSISAPGLLANDSDIDGNTLTALFYLPPQSGSVVINSDGSFTYTPNIGFFGTDTMSYIVSDGIINQYGIGVVTFTVIDVIPPIITVIPISANIELGSSPPSLLSGVTTNDGSPITVTGSVDVNTIGDYVIYYDSTDINGNAAIQQSRTYHVVDTVAPNVPVITSPDDGTSTSDPSQTITGTSEPNSTIEVFVNGASTGTTIANSAGNWSTQVSLSEGTNIVTATAFDGFNTSSPSEPIHIILDTVAPNVPVIISPDDGTSTSDPSQTITGTSEPNSTIEVFVNGASTGTTIANSAGNWSNTVQLFGGINVITATASDGLNTSPPSEPIHITLTVVNSLLQQKLALIEQLENLINSAQDDKTKKELKKAIKELRKGADSKLYSQDGNSFLDKKSAIKALKYDKQGIKHLVNIYHKGHESNSFKSELAEITIELLRIDKQLIINTYIGTHNLREGTLENFISSLRYVDAETNSEFDNDLSEYDDNMIENFGQSWNKIIHDKDAKKLVKEKMSWKEFVDQLKSEGKWDKAEEKAEKKAQKAEEKAEKKAQKAEEKAEKKAQKAEEKAEKKAQKAEEKAEKKATKK